MGEDRQKMEACLCVCLFCFFRHREPDRATSYTHTKTLNAFCTPETYHECVCTRIIGPVSTPQLRRVAYFRFNRGYRAVGVYRAPHRSTSSTRSNISS